MNDDVFLLNYERDNCCWKISGCWIILSL